MIIVEVVMMVVILFLYSLVSSDTPKLYRAWCREKGKKEARGYMTWCLVAMWVFCLAPGAQVWSKTTDLWAGFAAFVGCGSLSTYFALKEVRWAKERRRS